MSTTSRTDVSSTLESCRSADVTPVVLEAESLESTAPTYLATLKRTFAEEGFQPATVTVTARFDSTCSIDTQSEIDRIRGYVRAASFLGASTVSVTTESVEDVDTVEPALEACAERANREGVRFEVDGPVTIAG
ncbi:sugar phosphate isomerase/epimerase [Halovivax cerinus]|uniref:Sugar phosphate isomerase/epimerase n=1 Tax=Halovivax cerinus TaxID=1487865 RepID=A0ABD5NS23_9EURY|nr:sugar phosphate isomerase/epimerase [Halovivax cerinus]